MRKRILTLIAGIISVAAATALTACSDNEDEPTGENNLQSIIWTISGAVSGDADDIFDYEATILLPDGEKQTLTTITLSSPAKLTGTLNESEVRLPAEFTMEIQRKVKPDYTVAEDATATWSENFALNIALVNESDYCFNQKQAEFNAEKVGVRLYEWLPKFGDSTQSISIKVKKSGDTYSLE